MSKPLNDTPANPEKVDMDSSPHPVTGYSPNFLPALGRAIEHKDLSKLARLLKSEPLSMIEQEEIAYLLEDIQKELRIKEQRILVDERRKRCCLLLAKKVNGGKKVTEAKNSVAKIISNDETFRSFDFDTVEKDIRKSILSPKGEWNDYYKSWLKK